jgi:hypothetical protein
VRIYEYASGNWIQLGADIDGEAAIDRSGASVSFSADGSRVAIGAPLNDENGNRSGHVRVFEYDGGNWLQLGADIGGEAAGDESGSSVSLSADGSRVAIGAAWNDGNGSRSGHVRVFQYGGGDWIQMVPDIDGKAAEDYSGEAVSLSSDGSRVAIGAPQFDDSGYVRVFEFDPNPPAPLVMNGSNLEFLTVSNAPYSLLSTTDLFIGFEVMTNVVGNGSVNSVPIDFSSPQRFYKHRWGSD